MVLFNRLPNRGASRAWGTLQRVASLPGRASPCRPPRRIAFACFLWPWFSLGPDWICLRFPRVLSIVSVRTVFLRFANASWSDESDPSLERKHPAPRRHRAKCRVRPAGSIHQKRHPQTSRCLPFRSPRLGPQTGSWSRQIHRPRPSQRP